ncbi:hypothetical protein HCA50_15060 [Listeria innocua]|uniref:polymorphic toxin type 35 domain-containing protein n=1 Tax=Listeria innocua TaxID=1642 RepID=UPI0016259634|nr:polymorphic toxin type 35 domain-containing protein [Listeria innocua]MBC1904817.1 hypothetical protein [Listeria innocua]
MTEKTEIYIEKKHDWNSITDGSWGQVRNLINRTMRNGKESAYGSARQKTMKYGKRIIAVTFKRVEGEIRISDAWVKTK